MEKSHRPRFRIEFPCPDSQHFGSENAFVYHIIYYVIFTDTIEHRFLDACFTKRNRSECIQLRRIFLLIRIGTFNRQITPIFTAIRMDRIFTHKACRLSVDPKRHFMLAVDNTINQEPTLFAILNRISITRIFRQDRTVRECMRTITDEWINKPSNSRTNQDYRHCHDNQNTFCLFLHHI